KSNAALAIANKAKQDIEQQLEKIQQKLASSINEQSRLSQYLNEKEAEIKNLHAALKEANEKLGLAESNLANITKTLDQKNVALTEANKKLDLVGNNLTNVTQKFEQQIETLQAVLKERSEQIERFSKLEVK